jgi:aminoglycoside/choline kinase family phosphotransferase
MMFKEAQEFLQGRQIMGTETILKAGSDREYKRILTSEESYIHCKNEHVKENETFLYFTDIFTKIGSPVPEILAVSQDSKEYLLSDNGRTSLLDVLLKEGYTPKVKSYYQQALSSLAELQIQAHTMLDYNQCVAASRFDKQAILADLNYFKYYFLDLHGVVYAKHQLTQEFEQLATSLNETSYRYFMYRDFQSRNILVHEDKICFIDYQGGMNGPLQYDVASLLWQAKADLPEEWKNDLCKHYIQEVKKYITIDEQKFEVEYQYIVLVRLLQVLGAYGLRGLIEKRPHFISSISQGLENLAKWQTQYSIKEYPTLGHVVNQLTQKELIKKYKTVKANQDTKLKVRVNSFSYKKGIPADESGNGGGFVFDCRGVLNPGRYDEYKKLTGRDQPVKDFLESKTKIHQFLQAAQQAVDISIEDYLERGFENLMISFGCTGGQHRSVYSADAMAKHLKDKYNLDATVTHIEQEAKGWVN